MGWIQVFLNLGIYIYWWFVEVTKLLSASAWKLYLSLNELFILIAAKTDFVLYKPHCKIPYTNLHSEHFKRIFCCALYLAIHLVKWCPHGWQIPAFIPILGTCHTGRIGEGKKMELEVWKNSGCKPNVITIKQYSKTLWLQIWRTKWQPGRTMWANTNLLKDCLTARIKKRHVCSVHCG